MSRPALATVDDVAVRLGQAIDDEAQANARLADASEIVRAYADPTGETTWLNDAETDVEDVPPQVAGVVAQMVERAAHNPMGAVQATEQTGPYQRMFSFGPDAAARLYLSRNDKMVIRTVMGRTSIGTLSTSRGPLETPAVTSPGVAEEVIWP